MFFFYCSCNVKMANKDLAPEQQVKPNLAFLIFIFFKINCKVYDITTKKNLFDSKSMTSK